MVGDHSHSLHKVRRLQFLLVPSIGNIIFVSTLVVIVFGIGNGLLYDGDIGYHIRAGEEILKTWKVPTYDIFSLHTPPPPWTAHEWLAEVLFAVAYKFAGLNGVVVFTALLLATAHWLLFYNLYQKHPGLVPVTITTLLATATSASHWLARPHVFSLMLTLLWYRLLDQFQYENRNRLHYLPLVMIFWVNLHGGYFFGLILICLYICGNLLRAILAAPEQSRQQRRKVKLLFSYLILSIVACGINPRGFNILLFPLHLTADRFIMDRVIEFLPPNFHDPLPFKYMFLATMTVAVMGRVRLNLIECALLILLSYMALYSARYMSLYAIVIAPIFLKCLVGTIAILPEPITRFLRTRDTNLASINKSVQGYFWPISLTLLTLMLALSGQLRLTFDEKRFPVAAVDFMLREPIRGRMFNNDEFGDYIAFSAWPKYRVFMDGRSDMYGENLINAYLRVANVQPGWRDTLSKYGLSWVIFDTNSPLSAALAGDSSWQPIYSDEVATIFVMKNHEHISLLQKYPAVEIAFAKGTAVGAQEFQIKHPH